MFISYHIAISWNLFIRQFRLNGYWMKLNFFFSFSFSFSKISYWNSICPILWNALKFNWEIPIDTGGSSTTTTFRCSGTPHNPIDPRRPFPCYANEGPHLHINTYGGGGNGMRSPSHTHTHTPLIVVQINR